MVTLSCCAESEAGATVAARASTVACCRLQGNIDIYTIDELGVVNLAAAVSRLRLFSPRDPPPLAGPAIQGALGASGGVSVAPLCNAGRSMHVGRVRVGAGPSPGAGSGCLVSVVN